MNGLLHLDDATIAELLDPESVTDSLGAAFAAWGRGEAATTRRVRAAAGGLMASAMAAVVPPYSGGKVYATRQGAFTFVIVLFDAEGRLVCTLDGDTITRLRTPAVSALAIRTLSAADSTSSPSTWATACWPTSATRGRTRTTPSGRSAPGSSSWRRCAASRRRPGPRCGVRVGIATGLVVVGDLLGRAPRRSEAVVGETPNLAARLQALAEPDSVVIAAGTRRLVGGLFECADLGAVEAKGFAEPVRAYRVLGDGAVESRFEALHAGAP